MTCACPDGHAFDRVPFEPGKPSLIVANTVKGKGVSYMENQKQWHHKVPSDEQFALAMQELDDARLNVLEVL
jgi:transketolase